MFLFCLSGAGKYFKSPFLPSKFRCPLNLDSQAPTPPGNLPDCLFHSLAAHASVKTLSLFSHITRARGPSGEELWSSVFCTPGQEGCMLQRSGRGLLNLITWHLTIESESFLDGLQTQTQEQLSLSSGRNRRSRVNYRRKSRDSNSALPSSSHSCLPRSPR